LKVLAKIKRDQLKIKVKEEQKVVLFNKKKLQTEWRKHMRKIKTE